MLIRIKQSILKQLDRQDVKIEHFEPIAKALDHVNHLILNVWSADPLQYT